MSTIDVSVNLLGTGSVKVREYSELIFQDVSISMLCELHCNIKRVSQDSSEFISMYGFGSVAVKALSVSNSGKIQLYGTLNANVKNILLNNNSFSSMYGFLSVQVHAEVRVPCFDEILNFNMQVIDLTGCDIDKGVGVSIIRYKDDNYPAQVKVSTNGSTDITGFTFTMSTKISGETEYISNGSIVNASDGEVIFDLDPLAVEKPGSGHYKIEGNTGSYDITYTKGAFTIIDDAL